MTHISEEDLVLIYYNEPGVSEEGRLHLYECRECLAAMQSLEQALDLCSEWEAPEPEREFSRSVWSQIAPQIGEPRAWRWPVWKAAVVVAAMAALLVAAYLGGRSARQPAPSVLTELSTEARARILAISLADHLERAQVLLTEISNQRDADASELEIHRARAQDLVEEGRLIRQIAERESPAATLALLDDVERFMTELANAPDKPAARDLEAQRERISTGSLLFKVRIFESNLRSKGQRL